MSSNQELKDLQSTLNNLTRVINQKEDVVEVTPELVALDRLQKNNNIQLVEDVDFKDQAEQVAALQFQRKRKEQITDLLQISNERFKELVMSPEYESAKKHILENKKMDQLALVMDKFEGAINVLSELTLTADEDKVRMQSSATLVEIARDMIEKENEKNPIGLSGVLKEAAKGGNTVQANFAQIVISQRKERGLD